MTRRWIRRGAVTAIAATWLLGAGIAVAADKTVTMTDNEFAPGTVTIRAGETVTWTNEGQAPHNAVGDNWGTDTITAGNSDTVRFKKAGTYAYVCTFHQGMAGTVVVKAASSGGGGGGGGGNPAPTPTQPPTDALAASTSTSSTPSPAAALAILGLAGLGGLVLGFRRLAPKRIRG